jgi:hypothetical protein
MVIVVSAAAKFQISNHKFQTNPKSQIPITARQAVAAGFGDW